MNLDDSQRLHRPGAIASFALASLREGFVPFEPSNPNVPSRAVLHPRSQPGTPTTDATNSPGHQLIVSHYTVITLDAAGNYFHGPNSISVAHKPEDVIDLIPFWQVEGRLMILRNGVVLRPALLARSLMQLPEVNSPESGFTTNLIGGYLSTLPMHRGINEATNELLCRKSGVAAQSPSFTLGASYFPRAAHSPELGFLRAIRANPLTATQVRLGTGFESIRTAEGISAHDCLERYLRGEEHDLRQFHATLALVQYLGVKSELPPAIKRLLPSPIPSLAVSPSVRSQIRTAAELRATMLTAEDQPHLPKRVMLVPTQPPPTDSYLAAHEFDVVIERQSGDHDAPLRAQAALKQSDSILLTALVPIDGKWYVPLNIGYRPALALRDSTPHLYQSRLGPYQIEGIVGSTERASTAEGVASRAATVATEVTGLKLREPPISCGFGYASVGYDPERLYHFFGVLDPSNVLDQRRISGTYLVELDEARTLVDEGIIRDLPTITGIRLCHAARGGTDSSPSADRASEEQLFHSVDERLVVQDYLYTEAPELRSVVEGDMLLRRLQHDLASTGGMEIVLPEEILRSDEREYFISLQSTYIPHHRDHPWERIKLKFHDGWHYLDPDELPFEPPLPSVGELTPVSRGEYVNRVAAREANAVWLSEVHFINVIGSARFEEVTGQPSLAGLLHSAGFHGRDAELGIIHNAITYGRIPSDVIRNLFVSSCYTFYQPVIRELLLGYHVRDVLRNIPHLHRQWLEMPEVAATALRFDARPFQALDFPRLEAVVAKLHERHEGIAPVAGYAARFARHQLKETGINLAYLRWRLRLGLSQDTRRCSSIDSSIDQLVEAFHAILTQAKELQTADQSTGAAQLIRAIVQTRETVLKPAQQLLDQLLSTDAGLSADHRAQLLNRRMLLSAELYVPFRVSQQEQHTIDTLEEALVRSAGYSIPPPADD